MANRKKCPTFGVWFQTNLDSAAQNLMETIIKVYICLKTRSRETSIDGGSDQNNWKLICLTGKCGENCPSENYLAWAPLGIGQPIFFLALQGICFFVVVLFLESDILNRLHNFVSRLTARHDVNAGEKDEVEDSDVKAEQERVINSGIDQLTKENALVIRELTKFYGGFLAVDKLSLSIPQGECFSLLGVNGAGKTTTFKMMTGDETISGGSVYIKGHDVSKNIRVTQQFLGYCPQFDALVNQMTVAETLYMYARLRGIHRRHIPEVVSHFMKKLMLTKYTDKLAGNLRQVCPWI